MPAGDIYVCVHSMQNKILYIYIYILILIFQQMNYDNFCNKLQKLS